MKYFSTFSGIGGFEIGIQNAFEATRVLQGFNNEISEAFNTDGLPPKPLCVGYSEIDKYASSVYQYHFGGKNYGDITKINASELPDFDCLVGGFPCQAFSIAGKRRGFDDTRGTLFFELARILKEKQPRLFVFENVKGLLSHDDGRTFSTIIATIDELGYDCQWQVLNSKNFGVPQNRERVIIVGHLRRTSRPQVFPITGDDFKANRLEVKKLESLSNSNQRNVVYDKNNISPTLNTAQGGGLTPLIITGSPKYENGERHVEYKVTDEVPTIRATHYKNGDNQPKVVAVDLTRREPNGFKIRPDGRAGTLDANYYKDMANQERPGVMLRDGRDNRSCLRSGSTTEVGIAGCSIRRLTPTECERLQSFPDGWTKFGGDSIGIADYEISDSQRYKMCGNAVTTNVIQAVFERIFRDEQAL